jgi:hypothetical protein
MGKADVQLKRLLELIGLTLVIAGAPLAHAKSCEDDSLESVSDDGSILKMLSGQVFEVEAGDAIDTALWLPVDDVLVCEIGGSAVEIINTDENGEKASAQRLTPMLRAPAAPIESGGGRRGPKQEIPEGFVAELPKRQTPQGFSATESSDQNPYSDLIPKMNITPSTKQSQTENKADQNDTDTVYVKYRWAVSLAFFKCNTITRSRFISRICFDDRNNYMLVNLNGVWYHYCDIRNDTVTRFLSADSIGHFYNTSIKGQFDCRTGHVPVYTYKMAPRCNNGAEICKPWERDWSTGGSLPKDSIITDKGLIVLPSPE